MGDHHGAPIRNTIKPTDDPPIRPMLRRLNFT
jgi:hypothetical protein